MKLLRNIDVHLHDGFEVVSVCRKAGISDKSYYYWRKKFGGLSCSQVSEMKSLKKENKGNLFSLVTTSVTILIIITLIYMLIIK